VFRPVPRRIELIPGVGVAPRNPIEFEFQSPDSSSKRLTLLTLLYERTPERLTIVPSEVLCETVLTRFPNGSRSTSFEQSWDLFHIQ